MHHSCRCAGHSFKRVIEELFFIPDGADDCQWFSVLPSFCAIPVHHGVFVCVGLETGYPPIPASSAWLPPSPPELLPFVLSDELTTSLTSAVKNLDAQLDNLDVHVTVTSDLSRVRVDCAIDCIPSLSLVCSLCSQQWLKETKVSPDGFIQAAFQLAHRRVQLAGE